jgi:hypothetical protein
VATNGKKDLKRVYGFAEMEACECFGIAVKKISVAMKFQRLDAVVSNAKLFPRAKEGWAGFSFEWLAALPKSIRRSSWS